MWGLSYGRTRLRGRTSIWLAMGFLVQLGCTTDPTEILLFIDFDGETPIDDVEMVIVRSTDPQVHETMATDLQNEQFPLSIAFINDADTETDLVVEIRATGLDAGDINRRARIAFKPNDIQWARVVLNNACANMPCDGDGLTCIEGTCSAEDTIASEDWNPNGTSRPAPNHERDGGAADAVDAGAPACATDCWAGCNDDESACKPITALALGGKHTCAIAGGELWCWGRNGTGELGLGGTTDSPSPRRVEGVDNELLTVTLTHVAAGSNFTCAAAEDKIWCWGSNNTQVQGEGAGMVFEPQLRPTGFGNVVDLKAGDGHVCAATTNGVYCWGRNSESQAAGMVRVMPVYDPTIVSGTSGLGWEELALGDTSTCARGSGRNALCWGTNSLTGLDGTAPLAVAGFPATRIVSGAAATCGLVGSDWLCWGDNGHQELLSLGAPITTPTMIDTSGFMDVQQIIMGALHSCALTNENRLHCWGLTTNDGLDRFDAPPAEVNGPPFDARSGAPRLVVAGGTPGENEAGHTCAVGDGSRILYCWGNNSSGQLGVGTGTSETATPLPVVMAP